MKKSNPLANDELIQPRMRVIIDNRITDIFRAIGFCTIIIVVVVIIIILTAYR